MTPINWLLFEKYNPILSLTQEWKNISTRHAKANLKKLPTMPTMLNFEPSAPETVNTPNITPDPPNTNVSESDALKVGDTAKVNTLSAADLSGGSGGSGAGGSKVSLGGMVESKIVIELIDSLVPALLVVLFRYGKMVVRKTDLQLTAKEKDTLSPIIQACMDQLMLNFNSPWVALAVTGGMIYGAKVVEIYGTASADRKNASPGSKEAKSGAQNPAPTKEKGQPEKPPKPALRPWGEEEVQKLADKKHWSKAKCREWLVNNWEKKGGVI